MSRGHPLVGSPTPGHATRRHVNAITLLGAVISLYAAAPLRGQDVQPQVYTPAPIGISVIAAAYTFSTGPVLFDKTIPIEGAVGDIHAIALSYSRAVGILGRATRVDVVLPYVFGNWEGDVIRDTRTRSLSGLGDPVLRLVIALRGAPALRPADFSSFRPGTIVGLTLRTGVPAGQYDPTNLINLGSNRWWFGPQLGISRVSGPMLFEAYAGARFFQPNDEFLGNQTLTQAGLYTFQAHAIYRFRPGLWLAASSRQSLGGATAVNGGDRASPEANNRIGVTLVVPLGARYALRVAATTGLTATIGNDYTSYVIAFSSVF